MDGSVIVADGSYREGALSAYAHLFKEGVLVGEAQLSLQGGKSAYDAEVLGLLLGTALASFEREAVLLTDSQSLLLVWGKEKAPPALKAAALLARDLGLTLRLEKAPRERVKRAHKGAASAHQERKAGSCQTARLQKWLSLIPPNHRAGALRTLKALLKSGVDEETLLEALKARWTNSTHALLYHVFRGMDQMERARALEDLRSLDGPRLKALLKGIGREATLIDELKAERAKKRILRRWAGPLR